VAVTPQGLAVVGGFTGSRTFPTAGPAFQPRLANLPGTINDGFVLALAPGSPVRVAVLDTGFRPAAVSVALGGGARWNFDNATFDHTVTDPTGLDLFDSSSRPPRSTFGVRFVAAGSYPVLDRITRDVGAVLVPVQAVPGSGSTTTSFAVVWAIRSPAPDAEFDVWLSRPGQPYEPWRSGTSALHARFTPDTGTGEYRFRARVRIPGEGATAWSPPGTIIIGG
jgi:hypothetical protein